MSKRTRPDDGPSKRTRFESPSRSETTNPTAAAAAAAPAVDFLQDDVTTSTRNKDRRSLKDASGYESDSTDDEGETVVPSRKGKLGNKKDGMEDDEDEDMFGGASDAEEADLKSGKGKGKEKTDKSKAFLNLTDIEGQDFGRKSGNYIGERDDDDDDDDDDYDSEEEARKATQGTGLDGPMGVELTAFNMKSELGEGRMTADGESYSVNDRDVGEQYDRWLEGTDRAAVRKARRAKREQERLESERQAKEQEEKTSGGRKQREERLMREMVALLERGETVLEGLQRVGSELEKQRKQVVEGDEKIKRKKLTWAEKQRERRAILEGKPSGSGSGPNDMQVDDSTEPSLPENPFARLSTLISDLTSLGHLDVYSMTRESLQRMLPAAPPPDPTSRSNGPGGSLPVDTRAFEYRFSKKYIDALPPSQRPIEREVFGPFPAQALLSWKSSGVFGGESCENIELRTRGPQGPGEWGDWRGVFEAKTT